MQLESRSGSASTSRQFEQDGGIVEERISALSCSVRACSSGPGPTAASSCCRPMISCSVAPAVRAISAACSRPIPPTRGSASRRWVGERLAERAPSVGSRSTSSWSGTTRRVVAVRDRAEPPQGRHHPSVPHAAVPDRRSLRRRRGGSSRRAATRSTWSPPTTSRPTAPGALRRRPVRHRGPARPALRPVAQTGSSST